MKLWNRLREHMLRFPSQTVGEQNSCLTYEELVIYAEQLAQKLRGETLAVIYCCSELFAGAALLGCFAADVTAVPLSVRYGEQHAQRIIKLSRPSCLITDTDGALTVYRIADSNCGFTSERPALVLWTSGTTGSPKGAMLSETNLLTNIQDISAYFKMDHTDTILIARPLYHCAVLTGEFLVSLLKGTRIVFHSEAFQPSALIGQMREHGITVFCGTPTLLELLSRFLRRGEGRGLKHVAVSGECMSRAAGRIIRKAFPQAAIYHVYGLTEASPRVCYLPPEYFDTAPDCVGIPLASVKTEIRDPAGNVLPPGRRGMLWVSGGNVMQGYYDNPALSAEKLRDGWLCTGDLACITENGWLKILGRNDDLIIRAGMNIYPQEIEAALREDPRTKEVLAYGYPSPNGGTRIGVKISGEFPDEAAVRALCLRLLPPFQRPERIELTEELPKNGTGKVIRRCSA